MRADHSALVSGSSSSACVGRSGKPASRGITWPSPVARLLLLMAPGLFPLSKSQTPAGREGSRPCFCPTRVASPQCGLVLPVPLAVRCAGAR